MKIKNHPKRPATFPAQQQASLPLQSNLNIPEQARRQCLPLLAELLIEIIRDARKEQNHE
jgi:hypothetical protein